MANHPNAIVDGHLQKIVGSSGFTIAGTTATVTATLSKQQMLELIDGCQQQKFDAKVVGGALTIAQRN